MTTKMAAKSIKDKLRENRGMPEETSPAITELFRLEPLLVSALSDTHRRLTPRSGATESLDGRARFSTGPFF